MGPFDNWISHFGKSIDTATPNIQDLRDKLESQMAALEPNKREVVDKELRDTLMVARFGVTNFETPTTPKKRQSDEQVLATMRTKVEELIEQTAPQNSTNDDLSSV